MQESRDFDEIVGFLLTRGGGDDFGAGDVDDAAILDFWRAASLEPTSGFLTYRKTFRAFLRFADALRDEALHGGGAETGGLALGDGWYEPPDPASPGIERMRAPSASRVAWGADDDEGLSPIEELESVDIKFLLAGEARRLAPLAAHRRAVAALARSLLRDAGFGHAQGAHLPSPQDEGRGRGGGDRRTPGSPLMKTRRPPTLGSSITWTTLSRRRPMCCWAGRTARGARA